MTDEEKIIVLHDYIDKLFNQRDELMEEIARLTRELNTLKLRIK